MKAFMIFFFLFTVTIYAQDEGQDPNVIYKYRQYEKFDLGELEIKGTLIAPGDLSATKKKARKFDLNLYERYNFDDFTKEQIRDLR